MRTAWSRRKVASLHRLIVSCVPSRTSRAINSTQDSRSFNMGTNSAPESRFVTSFQWRASHVLFPLTRRQRPIVGDPDAHYTLWAKFGRSVIQKGYCGGREKENTDFGTSAADCRDRLWVAPALYRHSPKFRLIGITYLSLFPLLFSTSDMVS